MSKKVPKTGTSSVIMVSKVLMTDQETFFSIAEIRAKINEYYTTKIDARTVRQAVTQLQSIAPNLLNEKIERLGAKKIPTVKYSIIFKK